MADREKVLEGLESCAKSDPENWCYHMCELCPYDLTSGCKHILAHDALELLKEQEPVPPRKVKRYVEYSDMAINFPDTYDCGNCGEELPDNAKYCPGCGRAVKWDEVDRCGRAEKGVEHGPWFM